MSRYTTQKLGQSFNGLTGGLQAEIVKKRKEFNQPQSQKDLSQKLNKPLFTKTKRAKSEKSKDNQKQCLDPETEELMARSQSSLEKKARFYEEMNKIENIDSAIKHSESYLVDFESKIADAELNPDLVPENERSNTSKLANSTEYRKLASMVSGNIITLDTTEVKPVSDHLHYQEAVGKELREHGVGYFAFSTDEATRQEQMEDLEKIHEETEVNIAKRQKLLNATDKADNTDVEEIKTPVEQDVDVKREELEQQKQEVFKLIKSIRESTRKPPPTREWDRGKLEEGLIRFPKEKEERNPEFAPPEIYTSKKQKYFNS